MVQTHLFNSLSGPSGLIHVNSRRSTRFYGTKGTGAGTGVTQNHNSSSTAFPTFADIGAHGFLTYRVNFITGDNALQVLKIRTTTEFGLQPGRFCLCLFHALI